MTSVGVKDRSYKPGQPRHRCEEPNCGSSFARLEHLRRHKLKRKWKPLEISLD
jgi:hypothetical protein